MQRVEELDTQEAHSPLMSWSTHFLQTVFRDALNLRRGGLGLTFQAFRPFDFGPEFLGG